MAAQYIRKLANDGLSLDQVLVMCHQQEEHACLKHTTALVLAQLLPPAAVQGSPPLTPIQSTQERSSHLGEPLNLVSMSGDPVPLVESLASSSQELATVTTTNMVPAQLPSRTIHRDGSLFSPTDYAETPPMTTMSTMSTMSTTSTTSTSNSQSQPMAVTATHDDSLTAIQLPLVLGNPPPAGQGLATSLLSTYQTLTLPVFTRDSLPALPTSLVPPAPTNPNVLPAAAAPHLLPTMHMGMGSNMLSPDALARHVPAYSQGLDNALAMMASMPSMTPLDGYGMEGNMHRSTAPALATSLAAAPRTDMASDQSATMVDQPATMAVAENGALPTGLAPSRLNAANYHTLPQN